MNNFDKQLNQTGKQHNLVKNLITKYWYSLFVIKGLLFGQFMF